MKKRILSMLLCATLAVTGMVSANAAEVKEYKGFKDLGEEIFLEDNTVRCTTYNIDEDYSVYVEYRGAERKHIYYFKDSVSAPVDYKIPSYENYTMFIYNVFKFSSYGSGNIYTQYNFRNTGGRYKKVKVKLSEFSSYFNEDGTVTRKRDEGYVTYDFNKSRGIYESTLVIASGGLVQAVVPDENGEVELYISTDVNAHIAYYSDLLLNGKGGGGVINSRLNKLSFGNIDGLYGTDVNDATELQLYLAGLKELDTLALFHADINCDGDYDVCDVTDLQFALAKM
ncbi:MAG: hypothetical protein UH080_06980 [Ruminococcus sp.]|nr:hypothetical protein [Ruminococcus sp.]